MVSYANLPGEIPGITVYSFKNEYTIIVNRNIEQAEQYNFIKDEIDKINNGIYVPEVIRCMIQS